MAITRTQIAKQLLSKGGRIGLKGGADAATASFGKSVGYSGPDGSTGRPDKDFNPGTGGGGPTFGDAKASQLSKDQIKREKEYRNFIQAFNKKPFVGPGVSVLRNIVPGNTKLRSQFINQKLQNEKIKDFYQNLSDKEKDNFNVMQGLAAVGYDQYAADMGSPSLLYSGNVGGLEKYVTGKDEFGNTTYGYRETRGGGDGGMSDYERRLLALEQATSAPAATPEVEEDDEIINYRLMSKGGRASFMGGGRHRDIDPNDLPPFKGPPGKKRGFENVMDGPDAGQIAKEYIADQKKQKPLLAAAPVEEEDEIINYRLMAGGGMADETVGGIMDLESSRQMYGLGKLVKKVTRSVKKIAKSPIGKAALLYAGGSYLSALGAGSAGSGIGLKMFGPKAFASNLGMSLGKLGLGSKFIGPMQPKPFFGLGKAGAGILGTTALSYFMTPEEEEEKKLASYGADIDDVDTIINNPYKYTNPRLMSEGGAPEDAKKETEDLSNDPNYKGWVKIYEANPDAAMMNEKANKYLQFYNKKAEGGSIEKEPVAKKVMPLLDMNGKEKDYRETGGFVDMGRMEKADDVPARLSKNEFVFTADAVRNAGDGSVDKGAEVMYNMMKNLESGGDVSEESQGLEGARKMFQTSQRLEEVL